MLRFAGVSSSLAKSAGRKWDTEAAMEAFIRFICSGSLRGVMSVSYTAFDP